MCAPETAEVRITLVIGKYDDKVGPCEILREDLIRSFSASAQRQQGYRASQSLVQCGHGTLQGLIELEFDDG